MVFSYFHLEVSSNIYISFWEKHQTVSQMRSIGFLRIVSRLHFSEQSLVLVTWYLMITENASVTYHWHKKGKEVDNDTEDILTIMNARSKIMVGCNEKKKKNTYK